MYKKPAHLTVMTANILRFEDKRNLLGTQFVSGYRRYFGKYNPDVICMQEFERMINKDPSRDVERELFEPNYIIKDNLVANLENHCAIATREKPIGYEEFPIGYNANLQKEYIDVEGKTVCICNTHLDTFSEKARQDQIAEILKWMDKEEYVVLTADFNTQDFHQFANKFENNLFNRFVGSTEGVRLDSNGKETEQEGVLTSGWIAVLPNTQYRTNGFVKICFYDTEKQYVSSVSDTVFQTPANVSFIRVDCNRMHADDCFLVLGSAVSKKRKTYRMSNRGEFGDFWSWDWWEDYGHDRATRIDNVIVSSNIRIDNVTMTEILTSDHHALVAELTLL